MRVEKLYYNAISQFLVDNPSLSSKFNKDFRDKLVIDNPTLEASFYEILAKVHDGLGNTTKAQEYRNKAKKLKAAK